MKTKSGFLYSLSFAFINFAEAVVILATLGVYSPDWSMSFAALWTRLALRRKIRARAAIANVMSDLRSEFPLLSDDDLDEKEHCCEWSIQQERKRLHALLDRANVGGAK